jgi:LPXTG-site transpeptidase (sortase) family protein
MLQILCNLMRNSALLLKANLAGRSKQALHRVFLLLLSIIMAISGLGLSTQISNVSASSITVTSAADSGAGSLRAAISNAADGDTITFSFGSYPVTITLSSTIIVTKNLTIQGPGSSKLSISGNNSNRIFKIANGILRLNDLQIINGFMAGEDAIAGAAGTYSGLGGAIYVDTGAGLTAQNVIFSGNKAVGGKGGDAYSNETVGYIPGSGGGEGGYHYTSDTSGVGVGGGTGGFGGGGGSGSGTTFAGAGGYGGGGGGNTGAVGGAGGTYGGAGSDGSHTVYGFSGGGGGAGMGGAVFINAGGAAGFKSVTFSGNSAVGGNGGSAQVSGLGGGGGGGGAGLGSAIFNRGSLCLDSSVTFTSNTVQAGIAGAKLPTYSGVPDDAENGQAVDTSTGIFDYSTDHSCAVWDFPPTNISLSSSSVNENQPGGTTVGNLSSTDPDEGDTFTYSLVSGTGSTDNGTFMITGGILYTSYPLNYESKSSYNIRIRSTDSYNKYYEKSLTISVNDIDDAPTGISLSSNSVSENLPAGAAVGSLSTVDEDTTSFTYSRVSGVSGCDGSDNGSFFIDHSNLVTAVPFNYEGKTSYSVCIHTTENTTSALSYQKQFTINITNVNEAPTALTGMANTVYETDPIGTLVYTLSTEDPDVGDSFTYSLVSGTGDDDNSSFEISGDTVVTKASLDYETQSNFAIRVRSTDSGGNQFEQTFTFSIVDVNEPPTNISLSNNTIDENEAANTVIGDLSSVDGDSSAFTYSLVSGVSGCDGSGNSSFLIDGNTLKAAVSFDQEAVDSYEICVRSLDDGTPPASLDKNFTINISNVNETPTDITNTTVLYENEPANSIATDLSTTDPDVSDTFTYTLVSGVGDTNNSLFTVSGSELLTNAIFDYETKSSYSVRVRSTDAGGLFVEKAITISVLNENDAPTELALSKTSVDEGNNSTVTIGTLSAQDADGDSITFSLVSTAGCDGTDNASFSISSDKLQSSVLFDYETKNSYQVCVRATDNGSPVLSTDKSFSISVNDEPDAPIDISLSSNSFNENIATGSDVAEISALDHDAGETFTFSLVSGSGSGDNAAFTISGSHLLLPVSPNYETKNEYHIRIRVTDSTNLYYEKSFTLDVLDVNDAPTLNTTLPDQEFTSGNDFTFTIAADAFTDEDGDSVTYTSTLASGDALPAWLSFNPTTLEYSGNSLRVQSLTIKLNADDGNGGVTSTTFALNIVQVAGNYSPVVMNLIPNQEATSGSSFSYAFPVNTFADYDDDTLTYEAVLSSGDVLPTWLTFTPASRQFSGTPGSGDAGTLLIHVYALDGKGGEVFTQFSLGVDTNVSPSVITPIPDQNASRGENWTFTFAEDTFEDADEDTLTYTADLSDGSALPTWLSFDPDSRTFTGTIPDGSTSDFVYDIRVTAHDGTHEASDSFFLTPWLIIDTNGNLHSGITISYEESTSGGPLSGPNSYSRWYDTADIKLLYGSTTISELDNDGIQVCFRLSESDHQRVNDNLSKIVIGTSHNDGAWTVLATTINSEKTMVCAYAKEFSLFDLFNINAGSSSTSSDEETNPAISLPRTGFAAGWNGVLPVQNAINAYSTINDLSIKIPAIGVNTSIVGVPQNDGQWDVTWLGSRIGWLEGSEFPTWIGNSVLTGHVWDTDNQPGIFVDLKKLKYGDQIILHAWNQDYIYEVRETKSVSPNSVATVFTHKEDHSWLSLLTCSSFDEKTETYTSRTLVRAVLIKVVDN